MEFKAKKIALYKVRNFSEKFDDTFAFVRENWKIMFKYLTYLILPVCLLQAISLNSYMETAFDMSSISSGKSSDMTNVLQSLGWSYGGIILTSMIGAMLLVSAYQAVGAAIDIQRNVLDYNLKSETGTFPMMLRIGINSGEPIIEDGDFFGATVQIAARICSETKPNQILVSSVVKELSEGKKFHFNDIGMVELRGIQEKKQLFEVVWNKM